MPPSEDAPSRRRRARFLVCAEWPVVGVGAREANARGAEVEVPLTDLQVAMRGLMLTMADMEWPLGWAMALRRIAEFAPGWSDVVATDKSEALRFFEACAAVFEALAAIPDDMEVG